MEQCTDYERERMNRGVAYLEKSVTPPPSPLSQKGNYLSSTHSPHTLSKLSSALRLCDTDNAGPVICSHPSLKG